ncbi:hypothetical protein ACFYT3_31800 [Nocardia amikacinitolerans]|uniref:hypothetical protein n=1 Tax=Nocardia amikacinitolerans TaxID=756689 RepID=UPI003682913A
MTTRRAAADKVRVEGIAPHELHAAGHRLRADIARQCQNLALKTLGAPDKEGPQWLEWRAAPGTPARRDQDARLALVQIAIFVTAGIDPTEAVIDARAAGVSWSTISAAAGISKQASQTRWAERAAAALLERDAAADRRATPTPLVSVLDHFDAPGKGIVGEATRSRRGRRSPQPAPRPSGPAPDQAGTP